MEVKDKVLTIDGENQNTDEILSIYSLGERAIGMQNYYTKTSHRYNEELRNVYSALRCGGCANFFKIDDTIINLNHIDSLCIQTHPMIKNSKGAYSLIVRIKDGSNLRFGFESHLDAERYLKAAQIEMNYLQQENNEIDV